jgi:hypothetical protein
MPPKHTNGIQKKWIVDKLKKATALKRLADVQKILDTILQAEKDTKTRFVRQN